MTRPPSPGSAAIRTRLRAMLAALALLLPGIARAQLGPVPYSPAGQALDTAMVAGRTLAARASDRINLLDAPYNARCDGVLVGATTGNGVTSGGYWQGDDDTAAIAAAIAAAQAQHKTLYVPGGSGYCLMRTGNPLGGITRSVTIEGDGMDVSRFVWFLDEVAGSFAGVAAAGSGYAVGDTPTVIGGAYGTAPMKLLVQSVNAAGGIVYATPVGTASYTTLPRAGAALAGGSGRGATVNVVMGGPAIASPYLGNVNLRPEGLTLRRFSVIGQGEQNPVQSTCSGSMAILPYDFNEVVIEGVGVDYSRCMSIALRNIDRASITGNRVRYSARDGINTNSAWTIISGNRLEHVGDDGIAATESPAEQGGLPTREGVVISGNVMTDTQGIVALGSAGLSVTGNTLIRPKLRAINVATGVGGEGATPSRAITVAGNTITDLLTVANDPISAGAASCIIAGSTPAQAGTAAAVPGYPVAGTGEFVSPYPYSNANSLAATQPTPPGMYVTIADNVCVRTLNASPNTAASPMLFSSLGYGLVYGANGWHDFPMLHSSVGEGIGVNITSGTIQTLRVANNMMAGLGYAIQVLNGVQVLDGEITRNTFRDVMTYGVAFVAPVTGFQRIAFDGNLWDGDPYFASANRHGTGIAADGNPTFDGTWSGPFPMLAFQMPAGLEWRNNRFRNWASLTPSGSFPGVGRLTGNTLYANGGTGIGGVLPAASDGWDIVAEDGNPASPTFGQVLSTTQRDLQQGCLSGRYASGTGAAQCLTPGAGLALSPTGVISAATPSALSASQISANGIVAAVTTASSGGYVQAIPTCTVAAPPAGGTQAACAVTAMGMSSWTPANAGSGYAVGDFVSIVGTNCSTAPVLRVNAVGAGGTITATSQLTGYNGGACAAPSATVAAATTTSGSGSGLTVNVSWYITAVAVTAAGNGYTTAPAVTFGSTTSQLAFAGTATGTTSLAGSLKLGSSGSPVVNASPLVDGTGTRAALTGAAYSVPANVDLVRFTQTATVASQTVTLRAAMADGDPLQFVNYGGQVTALNFTPAIQGWANGSTLASNTGMRARWDATDGTWHREQ